MRLKHSIVHTQCGASLLTLVLFIAFMLTLIVFSIQQLSYIATKQISRSNFSEQAYFSAEGALFELTKDIEANPDYWFTLVDKAAYTDSIEQGGTTVYRRVELDGIKLKYSITSDALGAQKKLVGYFKPEETVSPSLDVVLVLDRSGSMGYGSDDKTSIQFAVDAARAFVDEIQARSAGKSLIGLVTFNEQVTIDNHLTNDPNLIYQKLDSLYDKTPKGGTNLPDAIRISRDILLRSKNDKTNSEDRVAAASVLVVLSDGVSQFSIPGENSNPGNGTHCVFNDKSPINARTSNSCVTNACSQANSSWLPEVINGDSKVKIGNCCSDRAYDYALDSKNRGISIYSVSLTANYDSSDCQNNELTKELGNYTMLSISGSREKSSTVLDNPDYPFFTQTANPEDLQAIFETMARQVTSPAYFQYVETAPNPEDTNR